MRKKLIFLIVFTVIVFAACLDQDFNHGTEIRDSITLTEVSKRYDLEDFTSLGIWLFEIDTTILEEMGIVSKNYSLEINSHMYPLNRNPLNQSQIIALIPETIKRPEIECGRILSQIIPNTIVRNGGEICIESVYIQKDDRHYEISLMHYLQMKCAGEPFVFDNGQLIRPTHVKSNEGYAYTMKRYYDARQASEEHTVNGAFDFLKGREDHYTTLVCTENPYKAKIVGETVEISPPDTRDRVWQLGEQGPLELNSEDVYNIADNSEVQTLTLTIKEENLPEKYNRSHLYSIQFNDDATSCTLNENGDGIFGCVIQYATTNSIDRVKNARFTETSLIELYNSAGEEKGQYNKLNEAVEAAADGDLIKVLGGSTLLERTQSIIEDKTITITSENGTYTIDYTESATRAFLLSGTASLTIQNAVVQNADIASIHKSGGVFKLANGTPELTVKNCIIQNNKAEDGGALYGIAGSFIIENSTLTDNTSTGKGGAVYTSSKGRISGCNITGNESGTAGGGILNDGELSFYSNTVASNNAVTSGNGIQIEPDATVTNSTGQIWRHFNSPDTAITIVEKTVEAENIYSEQGTAEGHAVYYNGSVVTPEGTLTLTPTAAIEDESITISIAYEIGCYFSNASITIDTPDAFTISESSSITIGTAEPVNASYYSSSANSITLTDITGEPGTTATLTLKATVPSASAISSRDTNHAFRLKSDADGSGSAWEVSTVSAENFTALSGENGSLDSPFLIDSIDDLVCVGSYIDGWDPDKCYRLTRDLDFNDDASYDDPALYKDYCTTGSGWYPIGPFNGSFDGDGHTIKNLVLNRTSEETGLFGCVEKGNYSPVIKDLTLNTVNMTTGRYSGSLAGFVWNEADIVNCGANNVTITGTDYIGGLFGCVGDATLTNCYAKNVVLTGTGYIGGLTSGNSNIIQYSYATGQINTDKGSCGGIAGTLDSNAQIKGCYSDVTIQITDNISTNFIGGIAGNVQSGCAITNSYALGDVTGTDYGYGGIVGNCFGTTIENTYALGDVIISGDNYVSQTAGLVGALQSSSTLKNSVAFNSQVSAGNHYDDNIGRTTTNRVVGKLNSSTIQNCYANSNMTVKWEGTNETINKGTTTVDGADINTLMNKTSAPLSSWEFDSDDDGDLLYWEIEEGATRPVLYVDPDEDGVYVKLGNDNGTF